MNEGPERIDYRETSDVTEVHAAIKREHRDPSAEVTPIPLWLTAVCGIAVCWAGAYLGVFHGGFSASVYNEYESSPSILFPLPETQGAKAEGTGAALTLAQQGKGIFEAQCKTCHQANGQGVAGQYPPLAKSSFVVGGEKRLIAILLKGAQGKLTVEGNTFNGSMPPWEASLNPKKIAAVASYIRSEWGNSAPEISEAKVLAAKDEFKAQAAQWTEAQILQIPGDATLPDAAGAAAPAAAAPSAKAEAKPAEAGAAPTAAAGVVDTAAVVEAGKKVYMGICVACHQPTGAGLAPVFPPLIKTEYVNGDPKRFSAIVLKGIIGPITIGSTQFNNAMPGQEMTLTDEKIAAAMTYVRASFGNNSPAVSADVVAAARKEFADRKTSWTEAELKAFGGGAPASNPEPAK